MSVLETPLTQVALRYEIRELPEAHMSEERYQEYGMLEEWYIRRTNLRINHIFICHLKIV